MELLAAAAVVVFGYALVSTRLENSVLSGPMLFTTIGIVLGSAGLGLFSDTTLDAGAVGMLAEATLLLVLFTDAIRIDLRKLGSEAQLPGRLLAIALPLSLTLGAVVAYFLFDSFNFAAAFVLAAILNPTDAALGKPVVTSEAVPVRIRQTINVESGLNDGIMLPVVTAGVILLAEETGTAGGGFVQLLLSEIGFGLLVGAGVGMAGGYLLDKAVARGMVEGVMRQLGTMAIGIAAYAAAELVGGNGFVAAFVGGLAFGLVAREHCEGAYNFAADEGELLTLVTFFLFGLVVVGDAIQAFSWTTLLYAVLSLTVIRMVPVAISLIGSGLRMPSVLFIGWFGPRGLASILFGVFLLEDAAAPIADPIFSVVVSTVLLSIFAHGASAAYLSRGYGRWYQRTAHDEMAESVDMATHPTR